MTNIGLSPFTTNNYQFNYKIDMFTVWPEEFFFLLKFWKTDQFSMVFLLKMGLKFRDFVGEKVTY